VLKFKQFLTATLTKTSKFRHNFCEGVNVEFVMVCVCVCGVRIPISGKVHVADEPGRCVL